MRSSFDVVVSGMGSHPFSSNPPQADILIRAPIADPAIITYIEVWGDQESYPVEIYFVLIDYYKDYDSGPSDSHWITITLEDGAHDEGIIINPDSDLMMDDGTNGTYSITIHRVG